MGALLAIPIGFGAGVAVVAAVSSTKIGALIEAVKAEVEARPAVSVGIMLALTLGPLLVGALARKDPE